MKALNAVILACCAAWWTGAAGADVITFNEQSFVKGPMITLGEIAEIEGEKAADLAVLEVGPAPAPAASRQLDRALVLARIRASGIAADSLDMQGARMVQVKTLHRELTREMVAESLRSYVESQMPWPTGDAEITVDVPAQETILPDGDITIEWRPSPDYRYLGSAPFKASVAVNGQLRKTFLCKATVEAYSAVVTAGIPIAKGKTISASDLRVETKPLATIVDAFFLDPGDATGFVAVRNIGAGEVVTKALLTPRVVVKRRQVVTVESRAGSMMVTTQARADSDGAEGDSITCTNTNSNQAFQGVVRRDGVVVVQ